MLDYLERTLTKNERRKVAKYMSQYKNMDAIIESKRMQLLPSKTTTLKPDAVQESNTITSEADIYLNRSFAIDELVIKKKQLDAAYNRVKPFHKLIWDEHFLNGVPDFQIYYDPKNDVTKKRYYQEKNELMLVVAECLSVGTNKHQKNTTMLG